MAKSTKRRKKRKPRKKAPGSAPSKPGSSVEEAATDEVDSDAEATQTARPKRAKPREPESSGSSERPAREARPKARPYWLIAAIAAVVAFVGYQQINRGETTDGDLDTTDVPITTAPSGPEQLRVSVFERYPHDPEAFTQGLLWHDGHLYESTGLRGESSLRIVDPRAGRVLQQRSNEDRLFAEGLARVGDELFQLTWQAGEAHVWTLNNFDHQRTLEYDGEGWGLCYDGRFLVMSDGSERLVFREPVTFQIDHVIRVHDDDGPVRRLNELECVDGRVWANVWQSERIIRIDPATGRVTGTVDASGLLSGAERWRADVLNGIAYVPERERFLITGKHWPWTFEVAFVPVEDEPDDEPDDE